MNKINLYFSILVGMVSSLIVATLFLLNQAVPPSAIGSSAGTTFSTEKFAGTVISLANPGSNGTSTSITNTDAFDRYVTSWKVGCQNFGSSLTAYTGAGLANLLVSVGTTTTSAPATFVSFAAIASGFTVPTTTASVGLVSSSTMQTATSALAARWPSGTAMTFSFNATNTAVCTVGVNYFGS